MAWCTHTISLPAARPCWRRLPLLPAHAGPRAGKLGPQTTIFSGPAFMKHRLDGKAFSSLTIVYAGAWERAARAFGVGGAHISCANMRAGLARWHLVYIRTYVRTWTVVGGLGAFCYFPSTRV